MAVPVANMDEWRLTFSSDDSLEFVNDSIYSPKYEKETRYASSTSVEVSSILAMDTGDLMSEFLVDKSKENEIVCGIEDSVCDYQRDNLDEKLLNDSCVEKQTNLVSHGISRKPLSTSKSRKDEILLNDFIEQKIDIHLKNLCITPHQYILSKETDSSKNNSMVSDLNGTLPAYQESKLSDSLDNSVSASRPRKDEFFRNDYVDDQINTSVEDLFTTVEQSVLCKESRNSSKDGTENNVKKLNQKNKQFDTLDKNSGEKSFYNLQEASNLNKIYCPHYRKVITDIGKNNALNGREENGVNLKQNHMTELKTSSNVNTNTLIELLCLDISKNILLALSSEELKRGASMTDILKYMIQNTNLKPTTKLKKDIKHFLMIASGAHILKRMRWNRYILTSDLKDTLQTCQESKRSGRLDNSVNASRPRKDDDSVDEQINTSIEYLYITVEQSVSCKESRNSSKDDTENHVKKPNQKNKQFDTLDKNNGVKRFPNLQETSNSNTMYCPHCKKVITDVGKNNFLNSAEENGVHLKQNHMAEFKISSNANTLVELLSIDISKNILLALSGKELKRGASMTDILKYIILNTNLKPTTKLKKDIKKFLKMAAGAHILKRMRWNRYILTGQTCLREDKNSNDHKRVSKISNKRRKVLHAKSGQKLTLKFTKKN